MAKKRGSVAARDNGGESKSQRTRARILDAAAHVLSVKGFAGTRLTDVAEYAEIQAPAIYYYFPSREDLIEEVMYCGINHMREHLQTTLDALPPGTSSMAMPSRFWRKRLPENRGSLEGSAITLEGQACSRPLKVRPMGCLLMDLPARRYISPFKRTIGSPGW